MILSGAKDVLRFPEILCFAQNDHTQKKQSFNRARSPSQPRAFAFRSALDQLPGLLGRLGEIEQLQIGVGDHALVGQKLEIDHALPIARPIKMIGMACMRPV